MNKLALHWQILIAIFAAIGVGLLLDEHSNIAGVSYLSIFSFFGTLFLNALKMIVVPLVLSSIIVGVSKIGLSDNLGRMGGKTLLFYFSSSLIAILIGLMLVNMIEPGIVDGVPAKDRLNLSPAETISKQLDRVEGRGAGDIVQIFLRMVPTNIVKAASEGQMLGLICFGILFGFFMSQIRTDLKGTMINVSEGVFETMMKLTMFIMRFAPIGVFGLIAKTVVVTGFEAFLPLLKFFVTVVFALAIHIFIAMPFILKVFAKVNPIRHYKAMAPAMLTAFSTASSASTLPVTMECIEKNAKVSNQTSSFVLPLGATVNMDGTALYECVAVIFIAQAYGLELSFATQFIIVLVALLTSIGVAGIPAASLVAITVILGTVGLPLEAIGMLLVTDRILDMMRTSVNVFSDSCCAVFVAKTEGEDQVLAS